MRKIFEVYLNSGDDFETIIITARDEQEIKEILQEDIEECDNCTIEEIDLNDNTSGIIARFF